MCEKLAILDPFSRIAKVSAVSTMFPNTLRSCLEI